MTIENNPDALYPVAAMTIGAMPAYGVILVRPDFLTHMSQDADKPNLGRNYALTSEQARHLAQKILEAADQLDKSVPSSDGHQKH